MQVCLDYTAHREPADHGTTSRDGLAAERLDALPAGFIERRAAEYPRAVRVHEHPRPAAQPGFPDHA
jgi:hypothetical protein